MAVLPMLHLALVMAPVPSSVLASLPVPPAEEVDNVPPRPALCLPWPAPATSNQCSLLHELKELKELNVPCLQTR